MTVVSQETQITSTEPKETLVMGGSRGGVGGSCPVDPPWKIMLLYISLEILVSQRGVLTARCDIH